MAQVAPSKVRSRKDGAAIPLDETDKKLLNLMQGRFPLVRRPYAQVAELAGVPEDEVLKRVRHLIEHRIIRQVTPIFDTRALGYQSMLVAAKVDPEYPHRAAKFINTHPGVTHNYLRNHDFNLWFTLATEPGSKLGLDGTLEVMAAKAGAESIRQLPTLRLFKIRMDLEMEKGTDALSAAAEAKEPLELEPIEVSERDIAIIRATQGDLPVASEPYAQAAQRLGASQEEVIAGLESLRERGGLRRVAAILYHRRAGFSANGMGVWAVPEDEILETGKQMAAYRGISHCYQRPTYADWPYSVFTMAHGRSKEECDAILDSIAEATGIGNRSTLYSSTEFKKIRMIYFTDDFAAWEREHGGV
ncbi:MAG: Lrp/AsnC family transcriptional regulator [Solirubrobacterales bacterium]|nr:Lrp/AsnC family transcriptional regulator [Solirubrobacterales bacterium]